jgi:hypothetical protein
MSPIVEKPTRELIAELCDGVIQQNDRLRLEQLLCNDPILQNEYLDQAMLVGLLRYEFGGDRSSIEDQDGSNDSRRGFGKLVQRSLAMMLLTLMCAGGYWWLKPDCDIEFSVPISNASFERDVPISTEPSLNGWYGDVARIVLGSEDNLAPDGKRMLQLLRSVHQPSNECEIYQVLDLRQLGVRATSRPAFIEATAVVNTRSDPGEVPYVLSLELYTYVQLPEFRQTLVPDSLSTEVMASRKMLSADSNPDSWEQISLVMPLSREAKFGIVKISVRDFSDSPDDEFSEVFVDNVKVRMTNKGLF